VPDSKPSIGNGPLSYRNWRAQLDGAPRRGAWETPLYSDAGIFGDVREGLGPYGLVHAFPADGRDPVLILSVALHLAQGTLPRLDKTNLEGFTGASLADELAALIALETGVRLAAGSATRSFYEGSSAWIAMGDQDRPVFFPKRAGIGRVLPAVIGERTIGTGLLATFPALRADVATSLVRAARSYRDALWVAEVEPELSWLLFVSALEVAAVQQQTEKTTALDVLTASKPKLVAELGPETAAIVAKAFARELGATRRFLDFMDEFMPSPREPRPPGRLRLDWDREHLREQMKKIYQHRSLALHEAIPFPSPLCSAPMVIDNKTAETTVFGAAARDGGVWVQDDLPFPLHTFEYMARGALLGWWASLARSSTDTSSNQGADERA
jgi:hypothetical protein